MMMRMTIMRVSLIVMALQKIQIQNRDPGLNRVNLQMMRMVRPRALTVAQLMEMMILIKKIKVLAVMMT